jgi:protein CWC15
MGSGPSKRCEGRIPPIFGTGHGCPHEAQIPVRRRFSKLSQFLIFLLLNVRQPGQTSATDIQKRDLRAELLEAEQEARNRKRKAEGKAPLPVESDEESNKRRKLLQQALELDKDDDDDDDEVSIGGDGEKDEDEDEEEEEDDTAELLRELEKIKRERAEEKSKQEAAVSATTAAEREADIATSNPLLNLAAALGQQAPGGLKTTAPGTFAVKKRWDDGA